MRRPDPTANYADHLFESFAGVAEMHQDALGSGIVETSVWEVEFHGVTLTKLNREVRICGASLRFINHRYTVIDSRDVPLGPNEGGEFARVVTRPAANIERSAEATIVASDEV
jgi:hypothetical protein